MNKPLLSICIPTYNRGKYLKELLNSITNQLDNQDILNRVEIIVSDNASSDNTIGIVKEYQSRYKNIIYFRNKENIGGTKNSFVALKSSSGEYLWLVGDDDILEFGAISYVLKSIDSNPDVGIISINFSQYSEREKKYIRRSFFELQMLHPEKIDLSKDIVFINSEEYFSFFHDIPSFFPSIVMKRDFWIFTNYEDYIDTNYAHYAIALLNIKNSKTLAIFKPLVRGLIPMVGWHTSGNELFSSQLGAMKVRYLVYKDSRNPFTNKIFIEKKVSYLKNFLKITIASKFYNFRLSKENKNDLKLVYGKNVFYFYFLPILIFVFLLPKIFVKFLFFIKRLI